MEILIADDEKFIREELKNTVEQLSPGNSYHLARNFDTALEEMKNNNIDIAFLDIRMPGKTGLELARAIKIIKPDIRNSAKLKTGRITLRLFQPPDHILYVSYYYNI